MRVALALGACLLSFGVSASDLISATRSLDAEIQAWKPGDEVPHRLLSFPKGDVPPREMCGLAAYGMSAAPYIEHIDNDALLEELIFDPRSESSSLHAAIAHLVDRKGIGWFARELAGRGNTRWELDALQQVLQSPFSKMEVAFIASNAMPRSKAVEALTNLKAALDSGKSWKDAYAKAADENPDIERRKVEPGAPSTLVGYWFSGWISASGFSFSGLGLNRNVPVEHLKRVVASARGGQLLESGEGAYLYYVFDTWKPDA